MRSARRRTLGWTALGIAAALAVVPSTTTAAAASTVPDTWWIDTYDLDALHQQGWTGEGVKVAVLDQKINPDLPVFDGASLELADEPLCRNSAATPATTEATDDAVHGTTVTAAINGNGTGAGAMRGVAPGADVVFYGYATDETVGCSMEDDSAFTDGFSAALQDAIDSGVRIFTTSVSSYSDEVSTEVVANAIAAGVIVVVATPNALTLTGDGTGDVVELNGVVSATAVDSTGALQTNPYGQTWVVPMTSVVAAGVGMPTVGVQGDWNTSQSATGSSFAAPIVAGMLALAAQRWPEATGNQLLQAMVRTTSASVHEPERSDEGYGFGAAWPSTMLELDPTQFPDENPLLYKTAGPTPEQIAAAAARGSVLPGAEPDAEAAPDEAEPAAPPALADSLLPTLTMVLVSLLVVVVIGAIVTVIIVISRKKKRPQEGTS